MGMRIIFNAYAVLRRGDCRLVLASVTDLSTRETERPGLDLAAAIAGARGRPVILLDHQPKRAWAAAARSVVVQLSGHSHGRTIVGLDRLLALANGASVSGQYPVDGVTFDVNNGTASSPVWRCGSASRSG